MRAPSALACLISLVALAAPSACFNPALRCRLLCDTTSDCPAGLTCHMGTPNLCAESTDSCETQDAGRPIKPPPTAICNKDQSQCIQLTQQVRDGLVLWLDPSNLPDVQQPVNIWPDQSGKGNDAHPGNPSAAPLAASNGVVFVQDAQGAGLEIVSDPSLDFGTGDFLILLVVGVVDGPPTALYMKSDGARTNTHQVRMTWALPLQGSANYVNAVVNDTTITPMTAVQIGPVALFGLRRINGRAELRVDGTVVASNAISNPDVSTDNPENLFLGVLGKNGTTAVSFRAGVVVRGQIADSDVTALESYLSFLESAP